MNIRTFGDPAGRILRRLVVLAIVMVLTMLYAAPAWAHGTTIDLNEVQAIDITARFDSGDPMAGAQVSVYSPADAVTPWLTGIADDNGRFVFTPDRTISGEWAIQVRTAGHGDWVYVELDGGEMTALTSSGGFTPMQIIIMSAAVIWGMIGTALYFARGRGASSTPVQEGTLPHGAA
jgi:nickel transport protein